MSAPKLIKYSNSQVITTQKKTEEVFEEMFVNDDSANPIKDQVFRNHENAELSM